jgi:hypothetical protein
MSWATTVVPEWRSDNPIETEKASHGEWLDRVYPSGITHAHQAFPLFADNPGMTPSFASMPR